MVFKQLTSLLMVLLSCGIMLTGTATIVHAAPILTLVLDPGQLTTYSTSVMVDDGGGPFSVTLTFTISGTSLIAEAKADTSAAGFATAVTLSLNEVFLFQMAGVWKTPASAYTSTDDYYSFHAEPSWGGDQPGTPACAREPGLPTFPGPGYEDTNFVTFNTFCVGSLTTLGVTFSAVSGDVKYTIPITGNANIDPDHDNKIRILQPLAFGYNFIGLGVNEVAPLNLHDVKTAILSDLTALSPLSNKDQNHELNEAIDHLTKSLDSKLWLPDGSGLNPKWGGEVFYEETYAVIELMELVKDGVSPTQLGGIINRLVAFDRLVAQNAITAAAGGKQYQLNEAKKELAKGDSLASAMKFPDAINLYGNAWLHAEEALEP